MEIWIIGGILVILMVIISTRIKKAAARAFEREVIETDSFTVVKPKGFLHPIREPADFPFEAYSKEYGERSTRNIWRARARLRLHSDLKTDDILSKARRDEAVELTEDGGTEGPKTTLALSRNTVDETGYVIRRKIVEDPERGGTWELKVTTLETYDDEFAGRAGIRLESFQLR